MPSMAVNWAAPTPNKSLSRTPTQIIPAAQVVKVSASATASSSARAVSGGRDALDGIYADIANKVSDTDTD